MNNIQQELYRFLRPMLLALGKLISYLHWWIFLLFGAYLASNIVIIQPDEVGLVLRFGRVVDGGTSKAVQQPGFLWALPRPIDEIVRIKINRIYEVEINALSASRRDAKTMGYMRSGTLDPERVGYVLTGDHNILHLSLVARYQISDPEQYVLHVAEPEVILQNTLLAEVRNSIGKRDVYSVLTDERQAFLDEATKHTQRRIVDANLGLALLAVELIDLSPPKQVNKDFAAVQTASIEVETSNQQAVRYSTQQISQAETAGKNSIRQAKAYATAVVSRANAAARSFLALAEEHKKNPKVIRQQLYRDKLDQALQGVGELRFIPPPTAEKYNGLRINIGGDGR